MSDLLSAAAQGARAYNGGNRSGSGPVPVSATTTTPGLRTPTDIMRQRQAREARKKAEQEERDREIQEARLRLEEQQRRPADDTTPTQRRPFKTAQPSTAEVSQQASDPVSGSRRQAATSQARQDIPATTTTAALPVTNPNPNYRRAAGDAPRDRTARTRGTSVSQGQPRPVRAQAAAAPEPSTTQPLPAGQTYPPPNASAAGATGGTAESTGALRSRSSRSGFPHAFERWETLSSHWEGLTSYWIRKLESNSEEMARDPLSQQMSRQITDLSAAGANLFHAVVELQRLRASSERKFQRWFFDTRTEQERFREERGEMERMITEERERRAEAQALLNKAEVDKTKAEDLVKEMRRELQISKDEARRAWEELGRREQEERDRTASLRSGEPTLVGGVQVVPMMGGGATGHRSVSAPQPHQSSQQRPVTREGPYTGGPTANVMGGQTPQASSQQQAASGYSYEDEPESVTGTDPYRQDPAADTPEDSDPTPGRAVAYSPGRAPPTSAAAIAATMALQNPGYHAQSSSQEGFYHHHRGTGLLGEEEEGNAPVHGSAAEPTDFPSTVGTESELGIGDEGEQRYSVDYDDDEDEDDERFELDSHGNYLRDAYGRRIPVQPQYRARSRGAASEDSDEYGVDDQLRQQGVYPSYTAGGQVQYGSGPTSGAYAPNVPTTSAGGPVDYSGGSWGSGWDSITPRHRHPTRLSDVMEEDERSRTSPSRASVASRRGGY